jgi:hypothetical protein
MYDPAEGVRTINEDLNSEEQPLYKWEWDESQLTELQLKFKRRYIDGFPELNPIVEQAFNDAKEGLDTGYTSFSDNNDDGLYPYLIAKANDLVVRSSDKPVYSGLKARLENADRSLLKAVAQNSNHLVVHEQEHLGAFRDICFEAEKRGEYIANTPHLGFKFSKDNTGNMFVQGGLYLANDPLLQPQDRHLTTNEHLWISANVDTLSAGDFRNQERLGNKKNDRNLVEVIADSINGYRDRREKNKRFWKFMKNS